MSARELVIGTRGSALALAQTEIVGEALRRARPELVIRVERIATTGDVRADIPLAQLGRGVFVSEIETALRERRIDAAVHSAKDLPSTLADDVMLAAILPRADARDVLVSRHGTLRKLPEGARVGTSSPRRMCQLRALRPDLRAIEIRGNVDTRLRKLASGDFDAIMLAAAGLIRLGRETEVTEWMDPDVVVPCVGQGALAVEIRTDDAATRELCEAVDDAATRAAVLAERAFLSELGAGCLAAAAAHATTNGGQLRMVALVGSSDGRHVRAVRTGDAANAEEIGCEIARDLLRSGGAGFVARTGTALAGKTIALTRPREQAAELLALLRASGARPVSCPTIAIEHLPDCTLIDAALRELPSVNWIVFTSANAVHALADRLRALKLEAPPSVRLAAIGSATASVVSRRIRRIDFTASRATAKALAEELPNVTRARVLFPHGDLAADDLPQRLRRRGADVHAVVVYRTVRGSGLDDLGDLARNGSLDAVVVSSPSAARFAAPVLSQRPAGTRAAAIICIGETTAAAAREVGLLPDVVAASPATGAVVDAIERQLSQS